MKQLFTILFLFTTVLTALGQDKYLAKGNEFLNNGEYEKAEKTFRSGIRDEPSNMIYHCQLGLTLIQQEKYLDAETILTNVLMIDSLNVGALWYSGIGNFKNGNDRNAIIRFEKTLTLLDTNSAQYYAANWYIGKSYSILLKTEGISYHEADRMFKCYEEYLRLQPDAEDAAEIREYIERKKSRRPSSNVLKWLDL